MLDSIRMWLLSVQRSISGLFLLMLLGSLVLLHIAVAGGNGLAARWRGSAK
jgi:hypothetical protein